MYGSSVVFIISLVTVTLMVENRFNFRWVADSNLGSYLSLPHTPAVGDS